MKIITGYTGEPHVKSDHDRAVYRGIVGEGSYILEAGNKLAAEVISANEIRIRDGVLSHQGCFGTVESGTYDTLAIANGAQGMQRKDLIVCRYERNSGSRVESMSFVVVQGTPAASNPAMPAYNEGSIADGDSPVDFPLYVINLDGIAITSVDKTATEVAGVAEIIGDLTAQISALESRVDDVLTDYIIKRSYHTGGHSPAAGTGTINYTYTIQESDIPAGYKPFEVRLATNGGGSNWYDFYNCSCDFKDGTNNREVELRFQKRSGTGGTIYPWIVVVYQKDLS